MWHTLSRREGGREHVRCREEGRSIDDALCPHLPHHRARRARLPIARLARLARRARFARRAAARGRGRVDVAEERATLRMVSYAEDRGPEAQPAGRQRLSKAGPGRVSSQIG